LLDGTGADQRRCHARITQHLRDRHLCEGLAALPCYIIEHADRSQVLVA